MLVLLPPSETKRDRRGRGHPARLRRAVLARADPAAPRRGRGRPAAVAQPRRRDRRAAPRRHAGRTRSPRNRVILTSPTLPAIDRYDGVLYEGLDAGDADERSARVRGPARRDRVGGVRADRRPWIRFPAYRLSHDSRLPGCPLGRLWRAPIAARARRRPRACCSICAPRRMRRSGRCPSAPMRSSSGSSARTTSGRRRALNHFNKKGKGEFVRRRLDRGGHRPSGCRLAAGLGGGAGHPPRAGCAGRTRSRSLSHAQPRPERSRQRHRRRA